MKEVVRVKRTDGSLSQVVIGDLLGALDEYLPQRRVIVITDPNVYRHYSGLIDRFEHIVTGLGETEKTLSSVSAIYEKLIALRADRECFILGIGGGIVTDMAGFVASTYMRGVRFGFVATTLLAQVDASVGGKNGVNVMGYKNMAGTFNQPDFVLCDTSVLSTLPERELRAGMAEMIKAGVIADPDLFAMFEENGFDRFRVDDSLLTKAIAASVRVKAAIVEADEREAGERRKLNLGHTFAHAIEKSSSDFLHGEAVAIGLAMAAEVSVRLGALDEFTAARIKDVIVNAGLPVTSGLDISQLLKALRLDKKRDNDHMNFVVIDSIGECSVRRIKFRELDDFFKYARTLVNR